jgi:hypothetical protein
MKFESMTHMAHALVRGKRFRVGTGGVVYYDERFANPFRFENNHIGVLMELFDQDIWTKVGPKNIHQDLIDSYQDGQAWQHMVAPMQGLYLNIKNQNKWIEPSWDERIVYRLHPHNTLIQAFNSGAKIQVCNTYGNWVDEPNPCWYEDTQYRIKPTTKTVYEWMYKDRFNHKWKFVDSLMNEEEAKLYFCDLEYQKTGRSLEVEV